MPPVEQKAGKKNPVPRKAPGSYKVVYLKE